MSKIPLTKKLPNKPSALLAAAVEDFQKVRNDRRYTIDMEEWWHSAQENPEDPYCSVCLAGAVMAQRVTNKKIAYSPKDFARGNEKKFLALDALRVGNTSEAFFQLGLSPSAGQSFSRVMTAYRNNPHGFVSDLLKLSEDLKKAGY